MEESYLPRRHDPETTCVCRGTSCSWNNHELGWCQKAGCPTKIEELAPEFSFGFEYNLGDFNYETYDFDSFTPEKAHFGEMKCESEPEKFWPDGTARPGTKCSITCQEGFILAEGKHTDLICEDSWTWGYQWSVFQEAWDDHGGLGNGGCHWGDGDCWIYPYCIPDDFYVIDTRPLG